MITQSKLIVFSHDNLCLIVCEKGINFYIELLVSNKKYEVISFKKKTQEHLKINIAPLQKKIYRLDVY